MPTTTGKASELITFSRTSNATLTDSDGRIKWAPHNLLLASEQFDASNWSKTAGITTITANQTVAPNGTTTADIFNEGTGAGYRLAEQAVSTIASVTYTVGFYAKYISCQWVSLSLYSNSTATTYGAATFDLLNGVVGTSAAAGTGYAVGSPVMEDAGGGWYRCSLTVTNGSSVAANYLAIAASNASTIGNYGLNSYTGTSRTFHLWGASLTRSDLGGMKANTSAYPMYNPTTPKNLLGFTEDWSNAAWAVVTGTATKSSNTDIAPNGLQTADTLTATSADTIIWQTYNPVVNCQYTASIWLRRKTGSGTVQFTADGGTFTTITLTTTWQRFSATYTAAAGLKAVGVKIVTSGDEVYAWGAQLSDSASLDTYVPNYGAAPTAAAYYGPRLDADPVTLAAKGLLVEELRTNLLLYSSAFSDAYWTKQTVTFGTSGVAPDGTTTAALLVPSNTPNVQQLFRLSVVASSTCASSIYAKANGINTFEILDGASGTNGGSFNLSTGVATNKGTGVASIVPVGNGWYRCISVATTTGFRLYCPDSTGTASGDGTSGIYIWGAQLEAGSFPTSYIPVGATSAGATRNADVASVNTQAFPYSATEGTLVFNFGPFNMSGIMAGEAPYDTAIGMVTNGVRAGRAFSASNFNGWSSNTRLGTPGTSGTISGSSALAPVSGSAPLQKLAIFQSSTALGGVVNGGTVTSAAVTVAPTGASNLLYINERLNGYIRQITYLPRRLTNAELQTRTA